MGLTFGRSTPCLPMFDSLVSSRRSRNSSLSPTSRCAIMAALIAVSCFLLQPRTETPTDAPNGGYDPTSVDGGPVPVNATQAKLEAESNEIYADMQTRFAKEKIAVEAKAAGAKEARADAEQAMNELQNELNDAKQNAIEADTNAQEVTDNFTFAIMCSLFFCVVVVFSLLLVMVFVTLRGEGKPADKTKVEIEAANEAASNAEAKAEADNDNAVAKAKVEELEKELCVLKEQLTGATTRAEKLSRDNAKAEAVNDNAAAKAEAEELEKELCVLKEQLTGATTRAKKLSDDNAKATEYMRRSEIRVADVTKMIRAAKGETSTVAYNKNAVETENAKLTMEVKTLQAEVARIMKLLELQAEQLQLARATGQGSRQTGATIATHRVKETMVVKVHE